MSDEPEPTTPKPPRQRVERAPGRARRARLTPAPGSDPSPEAPVEREAPRADPGTAPGGPPRPPSPDDERLTRDRPPHWQRD
ncbi:hypothetical protein [Agromyces sp. NPDC058064]|uniref:hypothetical protein n=1 Tax=Agromyces sp. NPDC058064 TaxID=3346322 RepID=UPI0036DD3433